MIRASFERRPLVSVVMTVFDPEPQFFRQAVQSVLVQTLSEFELLIVEDPCQGGGPKILSGIADPRIRYFSNARRTSLVEQRNYAVSEARADLIAVLDCDDIAEPDRLERQCEYLCAHPHVAVLGSQVAIIDEFGDVIGHRLFPQQHAEIARAMHRIVPLCHPSVAFRKSAVHKAGGYSDRLAHLAEDYELYSRLLLRGARFANHPRALTRYRVHSAQAKARRLRETIRAVLEIKKHYWLQSMSTRDRLRMWAESCLLYLPEAAVLRLLTNCHYRDEMPDSASDHVRLDRVHGESAGESRDSHGRISRSAYLRESPELRGFRT